MEFRIDLVLSNPDHKVAGVEAGMASKLEEQEARWREKVKEMAKQHRKELSQVRGTPLVSQELRARDSYQSSLV